MATIRLHQTTTATPEQFVAGLTDFGPGRSELFPNSADDDLEVHAQGAHEADVTGGLGRHLGTPALRLVRSQATSCCTTTDSNAAGRRLGATRTRSSATPTGRPTSTYVVVREGKNLKGKAVPRGRARERRQGCPVEGAEDHRPAGDGSAQRRATGIGMSVPDGQLSSLSRRARRRGAEAAARGSDKHRDSTGHELCWHHPQLWALLPDASDPVPTVPTWPEFLRGCVRCRQSASTEQMPDGAAGTDAPYEGTAGSLLSRARYRSRTPRAGSSGPTAGEKRADDAPVLADQELLEVPQDVRVVGRCGARGLGASSRILRLAVRRGRLVDQCRVERVLVVADDADLGHHRERDRVLARAELRDLGVGAGLLRTEVVRGERRGS